MVAWLGSQNCEATRQQKNNLCSWQEGRWWQNAVDEVDNSAGTKLHRDQTWFEGLFVSDRLPNLGNNRCPKSQHLPYPVWKFGKVKGWAVVNLEVLRDSDYEADAGSRYCYDEWLPEHEGTLRRQVWHNWNTIVVVNE